VLVLTPASVVTQLREYFNRCDALVISHSKFVMKTHMERTVLPFIEGGECDIIVDECQILKNPTNKICKLLMKLRPSFGRVYLFSACPAPNSLLEYFMPSALINGALGNSPKHFYTEHSELVRGGQRIPDTGMNRRQYLRMGFKPIPKDGGRAILAALPSFATIITQDEISADMPEKTFMTRSYELTTEQITNHISLVRESIAIINDVQVPLMSRMAVAQKVSQNESGFVYDEMGVAHALPSNKLSCLTELLEEVGDEAAIIFTQYRYEQALILGELGDKATADVDVFKSGGARYLVGHPKSIGVGVSLEIAGVIIFYTNGFSWEDRMQAEGRTFRLTQRRAVCRYYDILPSGDGGVSAVILAALRAKKRLTDTVESVLNSSRGEL
jgi:hypothetical protein